MKVAEHRFSKRFSPLTCALFVVHEPVFVNEQAQSANVPISHRGIAAAIILPDGRYWIGVTLCSPSDKFVKAMGRAKAIGRAFAAYQKILSTPDHISLSLGGAHGVLDYDIYRNDYVVTNLKEKLRAAIEVFKYEREAGPYLPGGGL